MPKAFGKSITIPMKQSVELSYNSRISTQKGEPNLYFSEEVGEPILGIRVT